LYDAMPSAARKFLLAGRGGLNLTHAEPLEAFLSRYGARRARLEPIVRDFDPFTLRDWAHRLGVNTFVGSAGRVFPAEMKAAPLLRRGLHRVRDAGVRCHRRPRWAGWGDAPDAGPPGLASGQCAGAHVLRLHAADGERLVRTRALVLALGGASWARLTGC